MCYLSISMIRSRLAQTNRYIAEMRAHIARERVIVRVVASYTVLAATGALSPQVLGLRIEVYDPVTHHQQVRNAWGGVRTPDGR